MSMFKDKNKRLAAAREVEEERHSRAVVLQKLREEAASEREHENCWEVKKGTNRRDRSGFSSTELTGALWSAGGSRHGRERLRCDGKVRKWRPHVRHQFEKLSQEWKQMIQWLQASREK